MKRPVWKECKGYWVNFILYSTVINLCFLTLKNNYVGEKKGVSENKGCPKNVFWR